MEPSRRPHVPRHNHVILRSVGKWMYIYLPASGAGHMQATPTHLQAVLSDLKLSMPALPTAVKALDASAAGGILTRLQEESRILHNAVRLADRCSTNP